MPPDKRAADLAAIHLAKKQLGLDDETYRAMLRDVCGVASAAELDAAGRRKFLAHLATKGFQRKPTRRPAPAPERQALIKKIRAMLIEADRPDAYADGMAKRMCKVDRMEWCTPDQLGKIVAALVYDFKRRAKKEREAMGPNFPDGDFQ